MSLPIPHDLWYQLCTFLAQHKTCEVTLWQHEGRITKMALEVVMRSREPSDPEAKRTVVTCLHEEGPAAVEPIDRRRESDGKGSVPYSD